MGRRQHTKALVRLACAGTLMGISLWVTWTTSSYWQPCTGARWNEMNPSCAEAMSSYDLMPLLYLWGALALVVVALVVARLVPWVPAGVATVAAVVIACPVADPGFFWVEWGSADSTPGHGLWTACWIAAAGLALVYPSRTRNPSIRTNTPDGAATTPSVAI